jgi:large subunit ribosomal protein L28
MDGKPHHTIPERVVGFRPCRYNPPAMAAVCDVCGRGPNFGMQVSHSHRRSPRRWNPNIQRVRARVNGAAKRMNVCTRCLKAGKVQRAV